ncbi:MAG: Cytochrome c-type biosis protein CcmC [Proteobacteria bacterium]|nr:Cytochrome c-type biosis protein CcmC [Pseudomonadota bacterium]
MKTFAAHFSLSAPAANPEAWSELITRPRLCIQGLALLSVVCGLAGLVLGLLFAPASAQMGETYRIVLVHVPASWLSMLLYLIMAVCAADGLLRHNSLAAPMARAMAPTGALMAVLSLGTGALWGLPTWGTWWVWDARLTSMLILLFFYIAFIVLSHAIMDRQGAERVGFLLLLVGVINIPIVHFSVHWWNSLHQGASISLGKPALMSPLMLWGVLLMVLCFTFYAATMTLLRLRTNHALA